MSGKIQKKFFVSVFVAVVIPLLICTMVFGKNVKKSSYKNARENDYFDMQQIVKKLESDLNSVEVIGNSCCYRDDIRRFLANMNTVSTYEYVSTLHHIGEDFTFYRSLSPYIQSIGMTKNQELSFWSYISSYDDMVNMDMFQESWYSDYMKSNQIFYYSAVHSVPVDNNISKTEPVISRIKKVTDIKNNHQYLGEIIVNIKVSEMVKMLGEMGSGFDSIILNMQEEKLIIGTGSEEEAQYDLDHMSLYQKEDDCTFYNLDGKRIIQMPLQEEYGIEVYGVSSNKEVNQEIFRSIAFLVLISCLCLLLTMKVMFSVIRYITKPIVDLTAAVAEISQGNLDIQVHVESNDEIETLADGINHMVVKQKSFIERSLEYEKEKKQYEFEILISQINPHFLYNTLNTISFLALRYQHQDIHEISISLIRLLQNSIQTDGNRIMACVKNEIEIIQQYGTIQKHRYKNQFTISYLTEEGIEGVMIPKSIIQPLVENALFHGICPKEEPGTILLVIRRCTLNSLAIIVKDDGIGMTKKPVQNPAVKAYTKQSIGLANIQGRLRHLYGKEWMMNIKSKSGAGTEVVIIIPIEQEREKTGNMEASERKI